MPPIRLSRADALAPIGWNDLEALPIYAAMLLGLGCLVLALLDGMPTLEATTLKAVGIFGSLALRNAWLKLDEHDGAVS
ncbi:hypothetical protein [Sphingobium fuliginis]|uniref:Uncharacterized protein n=2 Tax=Sphingobium fuliginis (strain ATCC 27551) TaxID=336203 RepID=A0A292ZMQ0_SPHSA|nr:hypothetical protein [Sphingobium fuliginis]QDC40006.1 hypothetical protein FIL70_23075 [Sphingobium fuliginis ATCC 27551]GAY24153.1 hypothetical protein SFOMI_4733 [Sphingobium fuliginis]